MYNMFRCCCVTFAATMACALGCSDDGDEAPLTDEPHVQVCVYDSECPADTNCTNWTCASISGGQEHDDDVRVCVAFPLGGSACSD